MANTGEARIAARFAALKAEKLANAINIPEDVRGFLQKFDNAILQSTSTVVNGFVEIGNLRKFAQSLRSEEHTSEPSHT